MDRLKFALYLIQSNRGIASVLFTIAFAINSFAAPSNTAPVTTVSSPNLNTITQTYTFKQLGWDSSVTMNGYKPNYTFYFPVSKRFSIQKAVLHLKLEFSPALAQGSQVNLKLNQTLIGRLAMPTNPESEATWDIELPLNRFVDDWQALTFSSYLMNGQSLCAPNVWVYISPQTTLTLSYIQTPFNGNLNQLPDPFINPEAVEPVTTTLLLPKEPSTEEIISLFQVAQRLGEVAGDAKVTLLTQSLDDIQEQQKMATNLILVGLANHLLSPTNTVSATLANNNEFNTALKSQSGIITLAQSPLNPLFGFLTITGADLPALQKAISAFTIPEFKSLASGQIAVINDLKVTQPSEKSNEWLQTTFKEMGYANQSISGLGHHTISYTIGLPNDRTPEKATIKTYITAPIFKDKDFSQITLLVNGQKQASIKLNKEQTQWNAIVQADAMKPGANKLDYVIDLHMENEQCTRDNYDEIWATIHAESTLETSFLDAFPQAMLNQLPVPFESELTVILPDQLSKEDFTLFTNLFFKLGQLNEERLPHFNIVTSNEVNEDFIRNHNIILVGTPDNNPWIKLALEYLPLQIQDHSRILNTQKKHLEVSNTLSSGLLELVQSPWNERSAVLLVAGNNTQSLHWAINTLMNDKIRPTLNGNIALINPDQSIEVLNSYENPYVNLQHKIMHSLTNYFKNTLYYLKNHPQTLIYFVAFLVPLFIYLRRRKK